MLFTTMSTWLPSVMKWSGADRAAGSPGVVPASVHLPGRGTHRDHLFSFQAFAQVVHLDRFREMEERYLPSETLEERYKGGRSIV
jgi:hypothetical protein